MIPYDQVLKGLVLALGAALFGANALALYRRRSDALRAQSRTAADRPKHSHDTTRDLAQAPVARTVTYMAIGLVVMIWSLASIVG